MAKLVFNYGAMGSSKTIMHLWLYNYEERAYALILKPATDTRDGIHVLQNRSFITCRLIDEFLDEFTKNPRLCIKLQCDYC